MSHALAYLYSMVHIVEGRIELHRLEGRKDGGATAVEYGLMVGLIAVVIIVAVTLLGRSCRPPLNNISGRRCLRRRLARNRHPAQWTGTPRRRI